MRQWIDKLRERFSQRGLIYEDAAQACGVHVSTVGAWMNGRNEPPLDKLRKMAELVGVSLAWLLEDDPLYAATTEERALLALFRRLPVGQRDATLVLVRGVAEGTPAYGDNSPKDSG